MAEEYREEFRRLFCEKVEALDIDDGRVADEFFVSCSTVRRWKSGAAAPHPRIGAIVLQWLDQLIAAKTEG